MRKKAFTLIELLVVITIIVVLLALLTPALDKAIYQAELVVCASNFHALGQGTLIYAAEFKRKYPYLPGPREQNGWAAHKVIETLNRLTLQDTKDSRLVIREYVSMEALKDPLAPVELDWGPEDTHEESQVYIAYDLQISMQFRNDNQNRGGSGMFKIGDRLTWDGKRYSLLAVDKEAVSYSVVVNDSVHPDDDGAMREQVLDNESAANVNIGPASAVRQVRSYWVTDSSYDRGEIDRNFLYADNSVHRLNKIAKATSVDPADQDERIDLIPMQPGPQNGTPADTWIPVAAN